MIHSFGRGHSVTLHSAAFGTEDRSEQALSPRLSSIADVLREHSRTQGAQSLISFERLCRYNGLVTEINDSDYAEPQLAVIG